MGTIVSLLLFSPVYGAFYLALLLSVFGIGISHAMLFDSGERAHLAVLPLKANILAVPQYQVSLLIMSAFHLLLFSMVALIQETILWTDMTILIPYTIFLLSLGILCRYLFAKYGNIGETAFSLITVAIYMLVVVFYEVLETNYVWVNIYTGIIFLLLVSYGILQFYRYKLLKDASI